jgi:hypothetical protein
MKSRNSRILALLYLLVVGAASARAQGEASISGVVRDARGSVVAEAAVAVENLENGRTRKFVTDAGGRYDATLLAVGKYRVTVEKDGFQPEAKDGIALVVGQHVEVNFALVLSALRETITVSENAEAVNVTTQNASGVVGEREVKDLPLNGRSYDQLLTLNPGIVNYTSQRAGSIGTSNSVVGNMFSVSGRRPQDNLFLLNGVEFTSASEINNTPGGISGQLLGVDAVREFSVVSDDYGAEYGKRPGAQVNIVTASGSNQFHGSAYEFLRNSALDARNFFDHGDIPPFERNEFGASFGGPIKQNKSFIFANYEGFRQKLGLSDLTLVPDNASRAAAAPSIQPLLALWPVANGPELLTPTGASSGIAEAFSNPLQHVREDFGNARFDQNFSDTESLSVFYTGDDSQGNSPSSNPITFIDTFLREQVVSLSETHIFSPRLLNHATFGFSRGAFYFNSGTTVSLPGWVESTDPVGAIVVGGGTTLNGASQITNGGTNAGSNLTATRNLFTATDQVALTHGRHLLNFGVWFQPIQANDALVQDQYGQASFTSLQTFLQGTVSTYTYTPSATTLLNWRSLEGAFFAEDTIKLKPNLEVRIGFRGEFANGWNEAHGRASNYVFGPNGVLLTNPAVGDSALAVNNATFLPAPRIGVAWSPFGWKSTVIRAGFGTYYDLLDNLSYRLDQNAPYNTVAAVKSIPFSSISPTASYPAAKIVPSGVQSNLQTPAVESYTLKIEQQITRTTSLSVGYIGSHAYHELLSIDTNLPKPTICPASPCPAGYPAGTLYIPANAPLGNPALSNSTVWESRGVSSYNALQVNLIHRLSAGLQLRGAYTFSKVLDDGDSLNTSIATNAPAFVADPFRPQDDYGPGSFDIRHTGVISATYDLPFAPNAPANSWKGRLIGNWQVSGIETLLSGLPFTPQLSYNPSNDGDSRNPVRPSLNPNFTGNVIVGSPNEYFNPAAFIQPLPGTYGNAGRNILRGPGVAELDLGAAKRVSLTERFSLQFRAEFFNIFNHTNFNTPNPVVYTAATGGPSPTAGVITSTATTSRQIQFGLKLLW